MLRASVGLPGGLVDRWRLFWNQTCTCLGVTLRSAAIFLRVSTDGNLSLAKTCSSIDSAFDGMFHRVDLPLRFRGPPPVSSGRSSSTASSSSPTGESGLELSAPSDGPGPPSMPAAVELFPRFSRAGLGIFCTVLGEAR